VSSGLQRVREVARKDRRARFTTLLHHVTVDLLRDSFHALKREAAPGVDGLTWPEYEESLEDRLVDLRRRVHTGTYRAQPSKRAYIPKPDGRKRPLGIAALEDKVVQQAVVTVLNQIYEVDFLGFSYGFRPGRGAHDALDALWMGLMGKKVNWVLDADIQGFFDTISLEWLVKFLEHRIADRRLLRLIQKWLTAGVSEDGKWSKAEVGTPQGAVASPLLANVYLHYVFDLWVRQWRKKSAAGEVIVVRYADDFIVGFQYRHEAGQFLRELGERFGKFGLTLHPEKTRLIEFGRFAARDRQLRGQGKPETFDFLGFTHCCGRKRQSGGFCVKRKTVSRRLRAKLQVVKETLMRRRHEPMLQQIAWLQAVARGYYNYHAIPGNMPALEAFRREVLHHWLRALRRRSQRHSLTWERFGPLTDLCIPKPRILHPHPNDRFYAKHPK
jgi:group II intron reverse transcriptase/maturase